MTSATPKPRAGEHVPQFTQADQWRMAEFQRLRTQITGLQAERDSLRERERELIEALRDLLDRVDRNGGLGEYKGGVPFATKTARELLAKYGR